MIDGCRSLVSAPAANPAAWLFYFGMASGDSPQPRLAARNITSFDPGPGIYTAF
jgi:hypothetical protein